MQARSDLMNVLSEGGIARVVATRDELFVAAQALDFWRIAVHCAGAGSKAALLTKLSDALQFPDHFGTNLDALYDCMTDQLVGPLGKAKKGAVLVLEGVGTVPKEALNPVLDTLLDAAEFIQVQGARLTIVLN